MAKAVLNNALSVLVILGVALYGFAHFAELPASMPVHFDVHGAPNGYAGKMFVLTFIPGLTLALLLLIPALIRLSPKGYGMEQSRSVIPSINLLLAAVLSAIELGLISNGLHPERSRMTFYIGLSFSILLIGLGNLMGKIEPNFFVGIRLPWTLASPRNWLATHRFAGKVMVAAGLVLFVTNFALPSFLFGIVALLIGTLSPVVFSFLFFFRNERTS